jgi:protein phosphatase 1 regulatory subunit 7
MSSSAQHPGAPTPPKSPSRPSPRSRASTGVSIATDSTAIAADGSITIVDSSHRSSPSPARNKSGWDGKLRVGDALKSTSASESADGPVGAEGDHDDSDTTVETGTGPRGGPQEIPENSVVHPGEELLADEDLLTEYPDDTEEIDLVHCRISSIDSLELSRFMALKRICLRQNAITEISLPQSLGRRLTELDVYDNLISHFRGLEAFTELTTLDLSFNKIRHIKRLSHLTKLKDLYFVQNRISKIEGLDGLNHLRNLELGGNRVREIEGLDSLPALEELWLGKNKISEIKVCWSNIAAVRYTDRNRTSTL